MNDRVLLDLQVPSDVERIDHARAAVVSCLSSAYADPEVGDDLAMVAAELLENAVKYGKRGQPTVRLQVCEKDATVIVSVTNLFEDPGGLAKLQRRLEWLQGFDDPSAAFAAAMLEVSERKTTDESKLGLVRIAHEGGCSLDADFSVTGELTMHARRRLKAVPA